MSYRGFYSTSDDYCIRCFFAVTAFSRYSLSCGAANSFLFAVFVACATFDVACVLNITCDRIQEVQQLLCQKETIP